jgi:hypothetical protein
MRASYDIDAIVGFNKEQLDFYLRSTEQEIIELQDLNTSLLRRINGLEADIRLLQGHLTSLEQVKVEAKASKSVWRLISALAAALGALVMTIFNKNDK